MKTILRFTLNGRIPYHEWFAKLEKSERAAVDYALYSLSVGLTGKTKSLGGGLWELRLHISGGLRVYFSYEGDTIILLLCGGDKGSQQRDIKKTRAFLETWRALQ
ncbi:MAG: type II toxin-antitoxin system RelE/ParE family toxin [Bacteriovoracaceae bacterium]|nr:type II toxin-antitoxin system RelE/ParE family toxin [Bacteriovoracaceae bacterium]